MKEDFTKWIEEDEDGKAFFQEKVGAYVKENGFKSKDEVAGLISNKEELLKEKKSLKKQLENKPAIAGETQKLIDKLNEYDILDSEELESKMKGIAEGKADPKLQTDFKRLQKEKDLLSQENKSLQSLFEKERGLRVSSQKDAFITQALKEANIKPEAFKPLFAYFNTQTKSEIDAESGNISFSANDELSSPIKDYIKEWSETDEAKSFLQEPNNSGSGERVQNANGKAVITRLEWDRLPPDQQKDAALNKTIID